MIDLRSLANPGRPLQVLCLGAHSDDIEIGCGGTLLSLIEAGTPMHIEWCVLSGSEERRAEAEASARDFLRGTESPGIRLALFEDSYFPAQMREIKAWLLEQRSRQTPDIVFTHRQGDAHQDHRTLNELTWNLFRDQLILEYEIPKWDGDLGQPNAYSALSAAIMEHKVELLMKHFGTQRSKDWFDPETFRGLARLRGMECRAPETYAEAFHMRKLRLF
ncbi:LmbE family N-acetylglucosaminyl deacetylase [Ochrobactrum sp. 19YEA23]|uniref:PIG-L deacetylase family protein n=1 Tax=Ochrobactrum sp. 19YEA23 TaxID=3039854 RepID=UPI00247A86DD|nr:LmbE family N-acetylglucosaminyl deacetylase [Ochrobactrum sp. 19YEA23]